MFNPAHDARHRLERLLWQHTRTVDKTESTRGIRSVRTSMGFVTIYSLTDDQIRDMLPPVVAASGQPERVGVSL